MPTIISLAAGSARGFGLTGVLPICPLDGTRGIFALGVTNPPSMTRNKYTYSTCGSTASGVGSASCYNQKGSASGNSTRGIFTLGFINTGTSTVRNKYTYSICASTAACVAAASIASFDGNAAAGNSTRGIIALGANSCSARISTRNKYTYASCTSVVAAAASAATIRNSAAGNSTRGIFSLGCGSRGNRDKYTYATDVSTSSGTASASANSALGSAAGNSTRGIFALGCSGAPLYVVTTRNKYTYATCSNTACGVGAASAASYFGSATGNSTRGIFALGYVCCTVTTRNKYTYASCVSTACGVGAASTAGGAGSAVSWATCVNCGP